MSVWGSIIVAVATAVVTIGLNEIIKTIRHRVEMNRRAADWTVDWIGQDPRSRIRLAILQNSGHVAAFDVRLTITGDADYQIHPDAPLDKCRPNDAVLLMVNNIGTGVYRIDWRNEKGVEQGPVFRFPGP